MQLEGEGIVVVALENFARQLHNATHELAADPHKRRIRQRRRCLLSTDSGHAQRGVGDVAVGRRPALAGMEGVRL